MRNINVLSRPSLLASLSFLLIFMAYSCNTNNQGEWVIEDASKNTVLIAETMIKSCSKLILEISGETDDSVKINGTLFAGGLIQESYSTDWYDSKIVVQYEAYKAKKGKIRIKYYLPSIVN